MNATAIIKARRNASRPITTARGLAPRRRLGVSQLLEEWSTSQAWLRSDRQGEQPFHYRFSQLPVQSTTKGPRPVLARTIVFKQESVSKAKPLPAILAGDVVLRAGVLLGKSPLATFIGEEYNHGGVTLDSSNVHHVESRGYETVDIKYFFSPEKANRGAILRFRGPFASQIRARVANIAKEQRYVKIPGNPFSTAENLYTVNCNEFVHELYRQAIGELMASAQKNDVNKFQKLLAEYGDPAHAAQAKKLPKSKKLIEPKNIEFRSGGVTTGLAVKLGELAGSADINEEAEKRGMVRSEFEGRLEMRNLYPEKWARSWNPIKVYLYSKGFYTVALLRTYTPDSFVNSKYFSVVHRVSKGGL